jgi:hypothetical protein
MCIRVKGMNPAVDPGAWRDCHVAGDLSGARSRLAMCLDVAPDEEHATLTAAAVVADGRVRVAVVKAWTDMAALRKELPVLLREQRPQVFGWLPYGPSAALAALLAERKGRVGWPPPGVTVEAIRSEVPAVCMGLAEVVKSKQLVHANDPLLNDHVGGAERLKRGDAWVFSRRGEGHCDAAYAAAGAVHLARTLPAPVGKPRLIVANDS